MTEDLRRSPLKDHAFRNLVQQTLSRWHVPGMSIAVVDGDQIWAEVRS